MTRDKSHLDKLFSDILNICFISSYKKSKSIREVMISIYMPIFISILHKIASNYHIDVKVSLSYSLIYIEGFIQFHSRFLTDEDFNISSVESYLYQDGLFQIHSQWSRQYCQFKYWRIDLNQSKNHMTDQVQKDIMVRSFFKRKWIHRWIEN